MVAKTTDSKQHLSGDWTISGVIGQLDKLSSSLQKLESAKKKRVHIDCGKIEAIDMSGLQLIYVWMELVKMRGVTTELINLPDNMHRNIQRLGLGHCFTDNYPDVA